MKTLILLFVLAGACAASMAAPPTTESVRTLLEITQTESMIDQAYASMEQMAKQNLAQQIVGKSLSDEQRRAMELAPARITAVIKQEMGWSTMAPILIAIYQEAFDQAEIDGLIAFYKSPVGQSFVSKMPMVMNRSMQVMQAQMQSLMPKLKQTIEQAMRDAKLPPKS